jgi:hypothetical protein
VEVLFNDCYKYPNAMRDLFSTLRYAVHCNEQRPRAPSSRFSLGSTARSDFSRLYEENDKLKLYLNSAAYKGSALSGQLEELMEQMEAAILAGAKSSR